MRLSIVPAVAVVLSTFLAGCSQEGGMASGPNKRALDEAVSKVYPALVRIAVVATEADEGRMRKMGASGSGAIISSDGYVITNHHVAGRSARIVCRLSDRQEVDATLVGTDPMCDIAVLKLKLDQLADKGKNLPVAHFGDSDKLRVGDTVLAMGSPSGLSQSVTVGVVSNTEMILPWGGMEMRGEPVGMLVRWIGHDATIFHGNSGGPLVNLKGEIVGINEIGVANIGGAIPANLAQSVAEQIIKNTDHKVRRSWAGMESQVMLKDAKGPAGVLVSAVMPDSPAAKAGMEVGDVITEFDGQKVSAKVAEELPLFNRLVLSRCPGKPIKVAVHRGGETKVLDLTPATREAALGLDCEVKAWGIVGMNLTLFSALELQRSREGVLVQSVRTSGPCGQAKPSINSGDVIVEVGGQKVANLDDLKKVTDSLLAGKERAETLVTYDRGVQRLLTVVKIGKEPEPSDPSETKRAWLGVQTQVLTADLAKAIGLEGKGGVRVTQVLDDTKAQAAGLKVGDVILKIDNEAVEVRQVEESDKFVRMVRKRSIDQEVKLTVYRDKKEQEIPVVLEDPPTPVSELKVYKNDDLEFSARDMSEMDRSDKKIDKAVKGVLVSRVEPAGWANLGGLINGDILLAVSGKEIAGIADLEAAMAQAKKDKPARIVLQIKRGVHTRYLELAPSWQ